MPAGRPPWLACLVAGLHPASKAPLGGRLAGSTRHAGLLGIPHSRQDGAPALESQGRRAACCSCCIQFSWVNRSQVFLKRRRSRPGSGWACTGSSAHACIVCRTHLPCCAMLGASRCTIRMGASTPAAMPCSQTLGSPGGRAGREPVDRCIWWCRGVQDAAFPGAGATASTSNPCSWPLPLPLCRGLAIQACLRLIWNEAENVHATLQRWRAGPETAERGKLRQRSRPEGVITSWGSVGGFREGRPGRAASTGGWKGAQHHPITRDNHNRAHLPLPSAAAGPPPGG